MAEVVSVVDSNDFDVDFFDSVDFNLLGDYFAYNVYSGSITSFSSFINS